MEESKFWADQLAESVTTRKVFHYTKQKITKPSSFVVKTSASISGVLHIGRLSDTIRGESVYRALRDAGRKAEFIWVAEDMDPLRKIPEGVPKSYSDYLGMPVTDIPAPDGTHKSYAEQHVSEYFRVVDEFVETKMPKFSMREEYRKGNFRPYIKKMISSLELLKEIQNRFRREPLSDTWSPWQPICEKCGKIMTPQVTGFDGGKAQYVCRDYKFEKTTAKGCGHEGENDPMKGNGKLVWKSEWAAQWARWGVSSEGAGKEYQVPGSAFWVNGEIAERVLGFPEPVPIFYEHLMIDGQKMSASLGNVVYPANWLEVAPPELLRFLYNKKLMKTRSFSWWSLPTLYTDYDRHENVYYGKEKAKTDREESHMKRLYEMSRIGKPETKPLQKVSFEFAALVAQVFPDKQKARAIELFERAGHIKNLTPEGRKTLLKRLDYARKWAEAHAPEEYRIQLVKKPGKDVLASLTEDQKRALRDLQALLSAKELTEDQLYESLWSIAKKNELTAPEFFRGAYQVLLNRDSGPRLAQFIIAVGQDRIARVLEQV